MKVATYLVFVFLAIKAEGAIVGNPSQPGIFIKGLFSKNQILYLRGGYFYDNIYRAKFKDENLKINSRSFLKLKSQGGSGSLNIKNRVDLYFLLGSAKMNFDSQVHTKAQLLWSTGIKILFLKIKNFDLSFDGKYFQTCQGAKYFIIEKKIFPIVTPDFGFKIQEYQASLGISYRLKMLIPYIGVTYLFSTIHAYPYEKGLIRFPHPDEDIISNFISSNQKNIKNWGFVVGVGIISSNMVNINIESRMIDQNAVNLSAEIRF